MTTTRGARCPGKARCTDDDCYLIELRGLKQGDLAGIAAQSNLFAILAGKRKISTTLAGKLARYFNVRPAVFMPA